MLPPSEDLLPGTAPFADHPGYDARSCPLSEVVVARTYATNNGFRCYATGGHCVPGAHCDGRRAHVAALEEQDKLWSQLWNQEQKR